MRIGVVTWSSRRAGGAERYLANIIPALAAAGHTIAIWTETDRPAEREPISGPAGGPEFVAATMGTARAIGALREWKPDLLFCHGLQSPAAEARLLDVAPAVFFAHSYYGT